MHVIHAKCIRRVTADRRGIAVAIRRPVSIGVFGDAVALACIERKRERSACAGAGGVFALGFTDHVILLPSLFRQPGDVVLHVVHVHAYGRLARPLRVARLAGNAFAAGASVAIGDLDPALADIAVPFAGGDLEAAHGERFGEGHGVHRTFVGLATDFVFGGAHGERAGRQHDHFRAVLAVFEHLAGLRRSGLGQIRQCRRAQGGQRQGCQGVESGWIHVGISFKGKKSPSQPLAQQGHEVLDLVRAVKQARRGANHWADIAVDRIDHHALFHQVGGHGIAVLALDAEERKAG